MSRQDLALEQHVLREFKGLPNSPRRILLAISGGVDSIVMGEILAKWKQGLGIELAVAHVHHGPAADSEQEQFRIFAKALVRKWAKDHHFQFAAVTAKFEMKSEDQFRVFRERELERLRKLLNCDVIAFAHHQDDLLETRLIRLIRGSGAQGLRSMSFLLGKKLRPLLGVSSADIRKYAKLKSLHWIEDPSNQKEVALRNWLRGEWLPSLEKKRPGSLGALSRSLEMLSPVNTDFDLAPYVGLRRESFSGVSLPQQKELLARYLKALGLRSYAQTHVEEILKRLGTRRKHSSFEMLGVCFNISPEFLWASRV